MSPYTSFAILTFVAFIWGSTFVFVNLIVQEVPPVLGAFLRFLIASLLFGAILFFSKEGRTVLKKEDLARIIILGISGVFIYNYFFFWGLKITTPINGSLIIAANPAATALLSALYLKEKITLNQYAGILISFFGVGLVITRGSFAVVAALNFNPGDLMILVCMLSWAVFAIVGKEVMLRLSPLEATTYATLAGTIMFLPFVAWPLREEGLSSISLNTWAALLYMGIIGSVTAFLLFYKALRYTTASQAAIFVNMVPLFTMIISVFMGQPVFALQVVGGALIVFGVAITTNILFHDRKIPGREAPGEPAG